MALHCLVVNHNDFTVAMEKRGGRLFSFMFSNLLGHTFEVGLALPGCCRVPEAYLDASSGGNTIHVRESLLACFSLLCLSSDCSQGRIGKSYCLVFIHVLIYKMHGKVKASARHISMHVLSGPPLLCIQYANPARQGIICSDCPTILKKPFFFS